MSACVLDTDVVIAALDRSDGHHGDAAKAIASMLKKDIALLISTVNYAEALVRPAEDERTLQTAVDAIAALGIRPVAPTATIARDAARYRSLNVSLADGFAIATGRANAASIASFDNRVKRAVGKLGLEVAKQFG